MKDPQQPTKMRAEYDSGDHVHPDAADYKAMADYIPLSALLRTHQAKPEAHDARK
jgi:hypothetical protein